MASVDDAVNALAVLRDWLECNVVGDRSAGELVSSRPLQQNAITDFFHQNQLTLLVLGRL